MTPLLLALSLTLAEPPKAPWVTFPAAPVQPTPEPRPEPPKPETVQRLTGDEIYVVEAQEPAFLLVSPSGIVQTVQGKGPIQVYGRLCGGSGQPELKTFSAPTVFIIRASGQGRVELFVVKEGAKGAADIVRRMVDVNTAPQPPPQPLPTDPLVQAAQNALLQEPLVYRAADKASLANVYRAMVPLGAKIVTAGHFFEVASEARKARIGDRLPLVRAVLNAEFAKVLPDAPDSVLTPAQREAAEALLLRLAALLEGLQ